MEDFDERRKAALERVKAKREFKNHVVVYVMVNALLVIIWAINSGGYFWPVWPIAGWGIGLMLHAWNAYFERPITEEEIRQEMERTG